MRKQLYLWATASALALGGVTGATAQTLILSSSTDYGGSFAVAADGKGILFGGTEYTAVQQQDKLYGNFTLGAADTVVFSFAHVLGQDTHSIAIFDPSFATAAGATVDYTISVLSATPQPTLKSTDSDLLQTVGQSSLNETFGPGGVVTPAGGIQFTKTGSSNYSGNTTASFNGGPALVMVQDTVTASALFGSNVVGVENSFIQNLGVPGPVPGAGLGGLAALFGLGLLARSRGFLAR